MKQTTFKCDPLAPKAMLALQMHRDANPNGLPLYSDRSRNKVYYSYVIYETKTSIIVEILK